MNNRPLVIMPLITKYNITTIFNATWKLFSILFTWRLFASNFSSVAAILKFHARYYMHERKCMKLQYERLGAVFYSYLNVLQTNSFPCMSQLNVPILSLYYSSCRKCNNSSSSAPVLNPGQVLWFRLASLQSKNLYFIIQ